MTTSLLETAFHDVHTTGPRRISVPIDLTPRGTIELRTPVPLTLIDLRDPALEQLGLGREQIVAATPAHYACTREWAEVLVWRTVGRSRPVGLVWRSRIAELARDDHPLLDDLLSGDTAEVAVIIGTPHHDVPTGLADWHQSNAGLVHHERLDTGAGRALVDHLATEFLNAAVVDLAV